MEGADEGNTAFGLPVKVVDHKSGFDGEVAEQGAEMGKNLRRRPSEKKNIPQETLAARIRKIGNKG